MVVSRANPELPLVRLYQAGLKLACLLSSWISCLIRTTSLKWPAKGGASRAGVPRHRSAPVIIQAGDGDVRRILSAVSTVGSEPRKQPGELARRWSVTAHFDLSGDHACTRVPIRFG